MSAFEPSAVERAVWEAASRRATLFRERTDERRTRGVVHTPPELARGMAERTHAALIALGARGGLADESVHLVDPSCGTGAFLAAALHVGTTNAGAGSAPAQVYGWDLDTDALGGARETLGGAFHAAGWPLTLEARDTLAQRVEPAPGARVVVLGNPPWAARSENRGDERMEALLEDFRRDGEGQRLDERKLGVLSDAYVRFLRWSCEAVRGGERGGVVSLVMNASYVDGPVHRGLRAALCRWFEGVSIWDLGGSALIARQGERDENVFGVRPGVAVLTAWTTGAPDVHAASVRTWRVRGTLADKWRSLGSWPSAEGPSFAPRAPHFAFVRADRDWPSHYVPLPALMPFHQEGVQTNRDELVVDTDRERLRERMERFLSGRDDADLSRAYVASGHFSPARARAALADAWGRDPRGCIEPLAYRPFESAHFVSVAPLCHRPRADLGRAMRASEAALVTVRKDRGEKPWAHVIAVRAIPDNCLLSSRSSCRARAFPTHDPEGAPNLALDVVERWAAALSVAPEPMDIIAWSTAWLASRSYQTRFDAHLKQDYPRVPPPLDDRDWGAGLGVGRALLSLYLDGDATRLPERADVGHHREVRAPWGFARALTAVDVFASARFQRSRDAD